LVFKENLKIRLQTEKILNVAWIIHDTGKYLLSTTSAALNIIARFLYLKK